MPTTAAETTAAPAAPDVDGDDDLLEDEALVEEISIDGMCGVY
ncbi:MAG TPA: mycofactocin precursor MftA [Acidimicrobiales bacterium]|nr:mycofactocin precursor MftA [Acidimicrobiales bacterium]